MRRRDLITAAAGALVATALAGGVAWAAIPGPGGVIQGCYDSGGNVKVVATLPCPRGYTPFSWNARGLQGPPGKDGANGVDGSDGVSPTVTQLAAGDANCPAGGAAITDSAGSTTYACSGLNGEDGQDGDPFSGTFTSPNGQYSISITDAGITIARAGGSVIELAGNDVIVQSAGAYSAEAGTMLSLTSGTGFNLTSGSDLTASIGGNLQATIASNLAATIGNNLTATIGKNFAASIGQDAIATIARDVAVQIVRDATVGVDGNLRIQGATVKLNAGATCPAAARKGDTVNLATGSILTGSATVCIG